jgi:hypothetical protein
MAGEFLNTRLTRWIKVATGRVRIGTSAEQNLKVADRQPGAASGGSGSGLLGGRFAVQG